MGLPRTEKDLSRIYNVFQLIIGLFLVYILGSWAIDTGSLMTYAGAAVVLSIVIKSLVNIAKSYGKG